MCTYTETDGTVTNFAGHVQRYAPAIDPVGQSQPLLTILADLGSRLEVATAPRQAAPCFDELARHVDYYSGLSYRSLGKHGLNPSKRTAEVAAA